MIKSLISNGILAPMAGVTDVVFRTICFEHGLGLAFTEMVSAKGFLMNPSHAQRYLDIGESEGPVALQLFGHEPEVLAEAAEILQELPFCFIDINMGCPAPKITGSGDGAALLKDMALASRLIESVVKAVKKPVSVKFRTGWDERQVVAVEFAKMCEQSGASLLTLHGRTRSQFYSGQADMELIGEVKASVGIPVIANGDISSMDDARQVMRITCCDGAMIGRAVLGNPWIFEGRTPSQIERINMAAEHLRRAVTRSGEEHGVKEMRKHIAWYLKGIRGGAKARNEINYMTSVSQVLEALEELRRFLE